MLAPPTHLIPLAFLPSLFLGAHANPHHDLLPDPFKFFGPSYEHHRALNSAGIAFACFCGGGNCECPPDRYHSAGVLINVWPGYQCAYPGGACTWDDKTGALQNTAQTNCPSTAACNLAAGCTCPSDKNGDAGVLINQFTGYQCAYPHGACTWDSDGSLVNTDQTNCVASAKCKRSGSDS
ncbi:hypothetical protein EIP86_008195 [Pleurotus ostreatoroseus]|nr:hypothetical protein EIP86_008195 [Pleurotus ostreatoroseus]